MVKKIQIEYVIEQYIKQLTVPLGSKIKDVLNCKNLHVGIFGKLKDLDYTLKDGDRIEIYQQLLFDPKELRRKRAIKQVQNYRLKHNK